MIPKSDRNSQGSSKESRSLFVSAGRRMVGCHPMANGHGSNEPETTRTEPKGTDANRRTCKPTRGNDGGRCRRKSTKLKRNSPGKTKLKNDGCPWRRAWKCHSRKLTKTVGFRYYSSRVAAEGLRAKLPIPGSGQAQPFEIVPEFFEHALEDGNRFQLAGGLVLRLLGIVLGKSLCAVRVGGL